MYRVLKDMPYERQATGSTGNKLNICGAVIDIWGARKYWDLDSTDFAVLTHRHADHYMHSTCKYLLDNDVPVYIEQVNKRAKTKNNILKISDRWDEINWFNHKKGFDVYGDIYHYHVEFTEKLEHDVPCYGIYMYITSIYGDFWKVFIATDTGDLLGIDAKDFDYYFIERNYNPKVLNALIYRDKKRGKWSRYSRSKKVHLSTSQGDSFVNRNKGEHFKEYIGLHMSATAMGDEE